MNSYESIYSLLTEEINLVKGPLPLSQRLSKRNIKGTSDYNTKLKKRKAAADERHKLAARDQAARAQERAARPGLTGINLGNIIKKSMRQQMADDTAERLGRGEEPPKTRRGNLGPRHG